jgi:hypothetical protein
MRNESTRTRLNGKRWPAMAALVVTASLSAYGGTAFAQDSVNPDRTEPSRAVDGGVTDSPLHAAIVREGTRLARAAAMAQTSAVPQSNWFVRHPVLAGSLIGTAGGAVLAQTRAIGGANHDLRVALVGTAAGAWTGMVASAIHKARLEEPVGTGTKIAIIAGAIGFIAVPLVACYGAGGCGGVS